MLDFKNNEYDFDVQWEPMLRPNGEIHPRRRALVRTDTQEVLGDHGLGYQILKNADLVEATLDAVEASGVSKDWSYEIETLENGAKMRGTIVFNDLHVEPAEGDFIQLQGQFVNSYDGEWAYQQSTDAKRLACLNGMVTQHSVSKSFRKHTSNIDVKASAAKIKLGVEHFFNNQETWQSYTSRKVNMEQAEAFIRSHVAQRWTYTGKQKTNETQVEKLMQIANTEARNLGPTKWAFYNCLTYWSSHVDADKLANPLDVQRKREAIVGKAMKTKAWELL